MLAAQLADSSDMMGRLEAVLQLGEQRDKESVAKLRQTLTNDSFFGVRMEASRALRSIHSDEALEALLSSTSQPDARVRQQVARDIGGFYGDSAFEFARRGLGEEKNPAVQAVELGSLAGYAKPEVREILLKYLNSESYRNELAVAGIEAIRSQDDPAFIAPLEDTLRGSEAKFTTRGLAEGLSALGYIARNEEKKDTESAFLTGYLNDKRVRVRLQAIRALATLGDPKVIPVLEKLAEASKESPDQAPAEQAVSQLRAGRKPVDDFKNLRQEVLDLEKQNRDLRKSIDDLRKQVEAGKTNDSPSKSKAKSKTAASKARS
jgi:aminopeptidase N